MIRRLILPWFLVSQAIATQPPVDAFSSTVNSTSNIPVREKNVETFKNDDLRCTLGSCRDDRSTYPCGCDNLCTVYGDCCPEYDLAHLNTVPDPFIHCSEVFNKGFLLVSKCPTSWRDTYVRDMCERSWPGILLEYLIPVTVNNTQLSYKNMFCAFCHGYHLYEIHYWKFSIECKDKTVDNLHLSTIMSHLLKGMCNIHILEPTQRPCRTDALTCQPGLNSTLTSSSETVSKCLTFVNYVSQFKDKHTMYKNPACVKCLGDNSHDIFCSQIDAKISPDSATSRLSAMLLFKKKEKETVDSYTNITLEQPVTCSSKYEVFVRAKCQRIICPIMLGYKTTREICQQNTGCVKYKILLCSPVQEHHALKQYRVTKSSSICHNGEKTEVANIYNCVNASLFYEIIWENFNMIRNKKIRKMALTLTGDITHAYKNKLTTNCTIISNKNMFPDGFEWMLAIINSLIKTTRWPWMVNITYQTELIEGTNMTMTSNMEICSLKTEVCPIVPILSNLGEYREFEAYIWPYYRELKGMCLNTYRYIQDEQRKERNSNLTRVMKSEFRRLEQMRRSVSSKISYITVCETGMLTLLYVLNKILNDVARETA